MASKYDVTPQSLLTWKKQFLENASLAFDVSGATKAYKDEIEELKESNDKLAKALGNTTIERDWAVKKQHTPQKRKRFWGPRGGLGLIK